MTQVLKRDFDCWVPLVKAEESHDDWILSGPAADTDVADYDDETLEKAGVMRGLDVHESLGAHIDFEHMYPKTKDLKYLIGKAISHYIGPDGRPWVSIRLVKDGPGREIAEKVWKSVKAGVRMGLSIFGSATRHANDPKRLVDTKISFVTISPTPKGFGQSLQIGTPDGLYAISKSIAFEDDGWEDVEKAADSDPLPLIEQLTHRLETFGDAITEIQKAMVTGDSIVAPGAQGGQALRMQAIRGNTTGGRMARKEKIEEKPGDIDGDKETPDDIYDDEDEEGVEKATASQLEGFISKSVRGTMSDRNFITALAKSVAAELGIGGLRKSLDDFKSHIDDRLDGVTDGYEALEKALADIPASPAKADLDDPYKQTPLSKSVEDSDAKALLRSSDKTGRNSVNAKRYAAVKKVRDTGRADDGLISKACLEAQSGGITDGTYAMIEKAASSLGVALN